MAGRQLGKVLTSLSGEFLVAGQLCMRGYVASLTLKNYPDVDIFVLNPQTQKQCSVQVKTVSVPRPRVRVRPPRAAYPMGVYFVPESVERLVNTPFVFVTIDPDLNVNYYIAPCEDVAAMSERERRQYLEDCLAKGREVNPTQPRMLSLEALAPFKDQWDNLGLDGPGDGAETLATPNLNVVP
jgi:hypothetical protein